MYGIQTGERLVDEYHHQEEPISAYLVEGRESSYSVRFFRDGEPVLEIRLQRFAGNPRGAQNKFDDLTRWAMEV